MKIPYPPSPENVPDDLTNLPVTYRKQQSLLLAGLFVFLMFYVGLIALFGMVAVWCVLTVAKYAAVKIVGTVVAGTFFLFLVKGFFKRGQMNKEMHLEITEDEHPVLFGFIHKICDELGAPEPNKVFVSPDVNAAVMPRSTLVNLVVEPKKDLLIGLGLVNCINLSEFKSVLAHEFGHFSQSGFTSSYGYVASKIIIDLVDGEDWLDRTVDWAKQQQNVLSAVGYTIGGLLWVGRSLMGAMLKAITLQRLAVMRESEFHADLLAVKAAGSDAVALSLFRMRFGNVCLMQAINDLATAADHKLYTRDVFLHQERSEEIVRRKRKNPTMGIPPAHDHPLAGKSLRLFDPDEENLTDDVPEMRRTHPPAHELEDSAKATYIPAVVDHRSPWVLFSSPAELKERMTYKMYRMMFKVPKNTELTDAEKVQQYIDGEHAETTYAQKYEGVYDDRKLAPGDTDELNELLLESPWPEERMAKVFDKLYAGCRARAEEFTDTRKELSALRESVVGRPSPKVRRMIKAVEDKLDRHWEWFKSFDRRVYLLHIQMARAIDPALRQELADRYFFQLEVQRMYESATNSFDEADRYIGALIRMKQLPPDFFAEVQQVLRQSWKALKTIVQDARQLNFPAMKNFEEGERLADFILEGKLVPEPPTRFIKGEWVDKLMTQLNRVKNRCFRLHFKSIGGILALQEKIAAAWAERAAPLVAEVVDDEPMVAEAVDVVAVVDAVAVRPVVSGEIFDAEEVLDAEVLDAVPVPPADVFSLDLAARAPEPPAAAAVPEVVLSLPTTTVRPATAARPAVKITIIRPGEPSPFAP